jgi:hypothetical protein
LNEGLKLLSQGQTFAAAFAEEALEDELGCEEQLNLKAM